GENPRFGIEVEGPGAGTRDDRDFKTAVAQARDHAPEPIELRQLLGAALGTNGNVLEIARVRLNAANRQLFCRHRGACQRCEVCLRSATGAMMSGGEVD